MKLLNPINGALVDTFTNVQKEFINRIKSEGIDEALNWLLPIKNGEEISYSREIEFCWDGGEPPFTVSLSTNKDMSDSIDYISEANSILIGNLQVGTEYFWRVNNSQVSSFTTNGEFTRLLKIDGLPNVRDIGGCKIKQGMIFRGGELERCYTITEEGKHTFTKELGIVTELDLRADMIGKIDRSVAGETVRLVQLPYRPYDEVFLDQHKQGIVKIMEFLSDEANYPVYIHCLGGADRTGMIAIYLRALAGEDDEVIHTDYELTSLSSYAMGIAEGVSAQGFRSRTSDYYSDFINKMMTYSADGTLGSAVERFILDCGVREETIEKIRSIIMR